MKMSLHIKSNKVVDSCCDVSWWTGHDRNGTLSVHGLASVLSPKEQQVAAELLAIRFLLVEQQVFDESVANGSGKGVLVIASKGAVKKAFLGHGDISSLKGYTSFRLRLPNLEVSVDSRLQVPASFEKDPVNKEIESVSSKGEVFDTSIGEVIITQHALEQFSERLAQSQAKGSDPKDPLASLLKRLSNPALRKVQLDAKVIKHKERKYGADKIGTHWNTPGSRWHFVVSSQKPQVLITAYMTMENRFK